MDYGETENQNPVLMFRRLRQIQKEDQGEA